MLFLKCLILLEIVVSASEMTYIVSGGVLNSTHSLAPLEIVVKTKRWSFFRITVLDRLFSDYESFHSNVVSRCKLQTFLRLMSRLLPLWAS